MTHPPVPGPPVQPNFLAVMEAIATVTFPISKRELLEQVGDGTVIFQGRNVELHDLIKDLHDDSFDDEAEFLAAMERQYIPDGGADDEPTAGVTPTGPPESWQSRFGPGDTAGPAGYNVYSDMDSQRPEG